MQFKFVSREDYRKKEAPEFVAARKKEFGEFYELPEGGTNHLAIKGCEEILKANDNEFDFICDLFDHYFDYVDYYFNLFEFIFNLFDYGLI